VFLRVREAAEITRMSEPTIRRWITVGRLDAVRIGRSVLIPVESVNAVFEDVP